MTLLAAVRRSASRMVAGTGRPPSSDFVRATKDIAAAHAAACRAWDQLFARGTPSMAGAESELALAQYFFGMATPSLASASGPKVNCYEMSAHLRSAGSDMLDGSTAVLRACSRLRGDPSAILRNGATSYVEGAASILRASREGDHATWHLEASAKMIVAAGNSFNSAVEKIKDKYIVGGATGDWELINQINHEFESAKEAKDMVNEGLENFPFEVKEKHCCTDLILTRRYGDEDIEVVVSAPFLVTARPECDWDLTAGTSEDEAKSVLALQVTVTKGGSLSIFTCTASQTEVTVTTVYMRLTIGDEDKEEHVLSFEDESNTMLQQLVQRYLDLRGVTRMTTTFLQRLLSNKDVFVNIFWLEILKGFVKQRK